jgi:hypothetical protein
MDASSWLLPVVIVLAVVVTASYFFGRKVNASLMTLYSAALENAVKPIDQKYTWIGGYVGYRAEYKVQDEYLKQVRASLHLKPRVSLLYYPVARFTMPYDKLYLVFECKRGLPGEAHLIKKGQYRFIPAGIDRIEQFKRKWVTLGATEFELLYLDTRGERDLLAWAESIKADDYAMINHLSFTSSTNVVYAYVRPDEKLIESIVRTAPSFVKALTK